MKGEVSTVVNSRQRVQYDKNKRGGIAHETFKDKRVKVLRGNIGVTQNRRIIDNYRLRTIVNDNNFRLFGG